MGDSNEKKGAASELEQFDSIFAELVDDVINCPAVKGTDTTAAMKWFREVAEYNVPFGKKNRGISVATSFKELKKDCTEGELKRARILGWCVEWLQAFFLVADDIMDASITRRGQPCWYKKDGVGLTGINDSFFLESAVFQILRKHLKDQPYYLSVVELFHDTIMQTVVGQCLDMTTAPPEGTIDFTKFTMETYSAIVKWKTAFYSFYLPVALAMHMAGISDEASHSAAKTILLQMGHFFQVQDDYLDCYGAPEVIGKIGTDIQDNKCGWLVVQALKLATPHQLKVLQDNYGQHDAEKVERVKKLYKEMDISRVYADYEESSYQELMSLINSSCGTLPPAVFTAFAQKIYKRQK
ncbi:farnesyl pyrophosphate synthase-like isoform X2 [Littorina saxatilis]|uniref:Farnesyl pyrophosphate synthase n=2 Tax=Littorina saxatilis TaxID=31220 RepID=A0AAN9B3Q4_9CAEN